MGDFSWGEQASFGRLLSSLLVAAWKGTHKRWFVPVDLAGADATNSLLLKTADAAAFCPAKPLACQMYMPEGQLGTVSGSR